MNSSKSPKLSYSNIKVSELQCVKINSTDGTSVNELAKRQYKELLFSFFAFGAGILYFLYRFIDTLRNRTERFNVEVIAAPLVMLGLLWLLYIIARKAQEVKKAIYKKAQYGIVKSKYVVKGSLLSFGSKNYFIEAIFADKKTYIKEVTCYPKTYNRLVEGEPVLVVSFDDKTAYAVSVS